MSSSTASRVVCPVCVYVCVSTHSCVTRGSGGARVCVHSCASRLSVLRAWGLHSVWL